MTSRDGDLRERSMPCAVELAVCVALAVQASKRKAGRRLRLTICPCCRLCFAVLPLGGGVGAARPRYGGEGESDAVSGQSLKQQE